MKGFTKLTFFVAVAALAWGLVGRLRNDKMAFERKVSACHAMDKKVKFSCYRSAIEMYYHSDPLDLSKKIKTDANFSRLLKRATVDSSYANFGTNCHTFYHAAGDFLAESFPDNSVGENLALCSGECTAGCTMGLLKRTALQNNFAEDILQEFFRSCKTGEEHQCAHEIGHLLNDKYVTPVLLPLDEITQSRYGVKLNSAYQYVSAKKADFNAPFEECKKLVPESEIAYCLTGIGHNMFLFSQFSDGGYKTKFDECQRVEARNKNDCYGFLLYRIGINEAAPKVILKEVEAGQAVCNEAVALIGREDLKYHCYLGLGGGIGLYLDTEYGSRKLTDETIPEVQQALVTHAALCESVEATFSNKCYAGLMGTKFKLLYKLLDLRIGRIEKLLPELDSDFEVVG